eukprot:1813910-Alexandrium_andersonii.AAC.1
MVTPHRPWNQAYLQANHEGANYVQTSVGSRNSALRFAPNVGRKGDDAAVRRSRGGRGRGGGSRAGAPALLDTF